MIQLSYGKVKLKCASSTHGKANTIQERYNMQEKDFVSYEYRTKTVKAKDQSKAMDMYEAFGWEVTSATPALTDAVTLSLKRDRKQKHKQELTKLERQAEEVFASINALEKGKTSFATAVAIVFGVIATLILGGGMSMVMLETANVSYLAGGILLGLAGIVLCCINYPLYKIISAKKTKQVLPLIDDNEEKLAIIMEKGNDLLHTDMI